MENKKNMDETMRNLRKKASQNHTAEHIGEIKNYSEFEIIPNDEDRMGFSQENISIIPIQTMGEKENSTIYEIYDTETQELIGWTDIAGKLTLAPEYIQKLNLLMGEKFPELQIAGENQKDIYLTAIQNDKLDLLLTSSKTPEEILALLGDGKLAQLDEKAKMQYSKKSETIDISLMEQDLKEEGIQPGAISQISEITQSSFYDEIPEAKEYHGFGNYVKFVYLNNGQGMFIGMKNGKYHTLNSINKSVPTNERTNNVGSDGKEIEDENITGLMKVKGKERQLAFGFKMDSVGNIQINELRYNPASGDYDFAAPLETKARYPQGPRSEKVEDFMDRRDNVDIQEEAEELERHKREGDKDISIQKISDDPADRAEIAYEEVMEAIYHQNVELTDREDLMIKTNIKDMVEMGRDFTPDVIEEYTMQVIQSILKQREEGEMLDEKDLPSERDIPGA